MAKRDSTYRSKARPYLTSEEVVELTGASRRQLTAVEESGLCTPKHFEDRGGVLGWTFSQVRAVRDHESCRAPGRIDFDDDIERSAVAASRQNRRTMRRMLLERRHCEDNAACSTMDGFYLRYIPQRWLAVLFVAGAPSPGTDEYVAARLLLQEVAETAGWCPTDIGGTIVSTGPDGRTGCVFVELAAQPLSSPKAGEGADSGCYLPFGGSCAFDEDKPDCALCPRKGTEPNEGYRMRWASYQLSAGGAAEEQSAAVGAAGVHDGKRLELDSPAVARPKVIDLEVPILPGLHAVALPAGFYLCSRAGEGQQEVLVNESFAIAKTLESTDITPERETEIVNALDSATRESGAYERLRRSDECLGPITGAALVEDTELSGWCSAPSPKVLRSLRYFTSARLEGGAGFSVVCMEALSEQPNDPTSYEAQLYLDPNSVKAPRKKKKKKRSLRMGIAPQAGSSIADKAPVKVRCRECGAVFESDEAREVASCPLCGAAKPMPKSHDRQVRSLLEQADDALAEARWADVGKYCDLALSRTAAEPEALWLRILARYQVTWAVGPEENGQRAMRAGAPGSKPIDRDEDFQQLMESASPFTWPVYLSLAQRLRM